MLKYIILGIVQGLTEFLPVSSSGHLVIIQKFLGLGGEKIALSVVLHLGTVLALIVFFFKDILDLLRNIKWLFLLVIVTAITGIIGITGKDFFERLFSSPKLIAIALILTGIILILTKRFGGAERNTLNIKDALILGLVQGVAIIPGISRSGITIAALLLRRIDKQLSFRFSFLASIPAVMGAAIFEAKNISLACRLGLKNIVVGFLVSFITGIFALGILKVVLKKAKLYYFGYYCIFIALLILWRIK